MKFIKISSTDPVVEFLTARLQTALQAGKRVLWLVPGGSSIAIAAAVSQNLQGTDVHNLMVTLTDERFGTVGHKDSNWKQLADAGFSLPGAHLSPVLDGSGDRPHTTMQFANTLQELYRQSDYKLGFFGMGADGHTAGNIPGSPAVTSLEFAASFDGSFQRITMTPIAIAQLDEAVVYAVGEEKKPALEQLQQDLPLETQPAQALKKIPELTIFNDQTGEATL